jgi:dTMP kinase
MKKGTFIVFEGLDGSGKTTQLHALVKHLQNQKGIKCKEEREPSDGLLGLMARGAVKKKFRFEQQTLALLFAADRYEHIKDDILPCLEQGVHVVCDRYVFSNFAYQGLSCDFEVIYEYNRAAMELLMPDLTVFIDTPPEKTSERIGQNRVGKELFDDAGVAVRESFLKAFDFMKEKGVFNETKRLIIIDGNRQEDEITREITEQVEMLLL